MQLQPANRPALSVIIPLSFLLLCLFGTTIPEFPDKYYWETWGSYIYLHGLPDAYGSGTNYMPLVQYLLYVYGKLAGSIDAIHRQIGVLKVFALLFDFIGIWYVYKYLGRRWPFVELLLINILNIAFIYNSVIWGQFDAVLSTLNFIAVYYALKGEMSKSTAFFMLAFNMKVQAVVLLPVIGVFYLLHIADKRSLKAAVNPLLSMAVMQLVFLLPFLGNTGRVKAIIDVVVGSVGHHPTLSLKAYNLWHLLPVSGDPFYIHDSTVLWSDMSCKVVGLTLFFVSSFFALLPLLKSLVLKVAGKEKGLLEKDKIMLICALLYLLFFFFNTQMHERYSHPAFLFIIAHAFYKRKFLVYTLFSLAYFLSLESVMKWMELKNYHTAIFDPRVLALVYGIIIVYLFYLLYRKTSSITKRAVTQL